MRILCSFIRDRIPPNTGVEACKGEGASNWIVGGRGVGKDQRSLRSLGFWAQGLGGTGLRVVPDGLRPG